MDHVGQVGYELGQGGVRGWAERTRRGDRSWCSAVGLPRRDGGWQVLTHACSSTARLEIGDLAR